MVSWQNSGIDFASRPPNSCKKPTPPLHGFLAEFGDRFRFPTPEFLQETNASSSWFLGRIRGSISLPDPRILARNQRLLFMVSWQNSGIDFASRPPNSGKKSTPPLHGFLAEFGDRFRFPTPEFWQEINASSS